MSTIKSDAKIEALAWKLRRRQLTGPRETALETVKVIREYIAKAKFVTIDDLITKIKDEAKKLVHAQPTEHTVGNAIRIILHHIREEYANATKTNAHVSSGSRSIENFVHLGQSRRSQPTASSSKEQRKPTVFTSAESFKPILIEAIQDIMDELETVYDNVAKEAKSHIHPEEIVLTLGYSKTVEAFLKEAHRTQKFTVVVAETAPSYSGRKLAQSLAKSGIETVLVPDSSIYALMPRVNKVIVGAHAVLANGGMFADVGSLMAATAARAHSTPIIVCTGQFKFTPIWNLPQYGALDFASPNAVLPFDEGELVGQVDILNPMWDYVGPELIDVYITNDGDHHPSSIYRLIKEAYDDEDHEL